MRGRAAARFAAVDALRRERPARARRVPPLAPRGVEQRPVAVRLSFLPDLDFAGVEAGSWTPRRRGRRLASARCSASGFRRRSATRCSTPPASTLLRASRTCAGAPPAARALADGVGPAGHRQPRLQLRGGDGGRRGARRDRPGIDGVEDLPGAVLRRRDAGCGRTAGRVQLPVGVVQRLGGGTGSGSDAMQNEAMQNEE